LRSDQYISAVLAKCESLTRAGLWLPEPRVRPSAWLHNFQDTNKIAAAVLLDHFVYFSGNAVDKMLMSAYRRLRDRLVHLRGTADALDILDNAIFTSVEGEDPNVTDSGKLFCRKLRQTLALPDNRFVEPADALRHAANGKTIIFLDDLLGSGQQFHKTWKRDYLNVHPYSFQMLDELQSTRVYYLTLVATTEGLDRLRGEIPAVQVVAAHILDKSASIYGIPKNTLLPDLEDIPSSIDQLIESYHQFLRVPTYMDEAEAKKYGHGQLGLLLAFEHSTPDSTLPLFWGESSVQWTPLVRRT
jgi:hypothetical protein